MKKIKVNWTIKKSIYNLLKQLKKSNPNGFSISQLVEIAVEKNYVNRIELLKDLVRKHQNKMMDYSKELDDLKEAVEEKKKDILEKEGFIKKRR